MVARAVCAASHGDQGQRGAYARAAKIARQTGDSVVRRIAVQQRQALALHHLDRQRVAERILDGPIELAQRNSDGTTGPDVLGQCHDTRGLVRREPGDLTGAEADHRAAVAC